MHYKTGAYNQYIFLINHFQIIMDYFKDIKTTKVITLNLKLITFKIVIGHFKIVTVRLGSNSISLVHSYRLSTICAEAFIVFLFTFLNHLVYFLIFATSIFCSKNFFTGQHSLAYIVLPKDNSVEFTF